jgi:DNA-binding LytR/AlgR family response regulator
MIEKKDITLSIAVCDDESAVCDMIEDFIAQTCSTLAIKASVEIFNNGEKLSDRMSVGGCFDLIFLDIDLVTTTGIEIGKKIRYEYNDMLTQIVYISRRRDYAMQLFDIDPLNFLVKPIKCDSIERVMRQYLQKSEFWSEIFTFKNKHNTYKVKLRDIKLFASDGRKITIYTTLNYIDFYGSLSKIYNEQLAKHDFLFVHKSHIINYDYVKTFCYDKLILIDDSVWSIGSTKRQEISDRQAEIERRRRK